MFIKWELGPSLLPPFDPLLAIFERPPSIFPLGNAKLDLFFDFINFGSFLSRDFFGYYEEATLQSNDVFRRRNLGGATYGADGRIRPTLGNPSNLVIDNGQSRWRIQLGAKLSF